MDISKAKYLDPKNDLTFRKIFGQHPDILKSFLNSILPLEEDQLIETISYEDPSLIPILPELKHSIVDVKCIDKQNRQFIVEMQMYWTDSFKSRMLFNAGKAYIKQLDKGRLYNELCPVYGLSLVDDIFLKETQYENQFYHHYKLSHQEIPDEEIKGIELVFIELPKFKPQTFSQKKVRNLWLRFLTEIDENTEFIPEELYSDEEIKKALEQLHVSAFTKEELEYYEKYWDKVRVEKLAIADAKKGEMMALKKLAETEVIAEQERQKAEQERQKAEQERQKAEQKDQEIISMIKNMKQNGMTNKQISQMTGKPEQEIENI